MSQCKGLRGDHSLTCKNATTSPGKKAPLLFIDWPHASMVYNFSCLFSSVDGVVHNLHLLLRIYHNSSAQVYEHTKGARNGTAPLDLYQCCHIPVQWPNQVHGTISTLFLLICYTAKHQGYSDKDMRQDIQGLIECLTDLPWKFDVLLRTVALHYVPQLDTSYITCPS